MNEPMDTLSSLEAEYRRLAHEGRITFVTFHPSYSYEEFIEGLTVRLDTAGEPGERVMYTVKDGVFKSLCTRALIAAIGSECRLDPDSSTWREAFDKHQELGPPDWQSAPRFILIIDEINRGDISKIFGELVTLLEADKRLGAENQLIARLPVSGDDFGVPPNVYIIGTMNTADRSIALVDIALRRRFGFVEMNPDFDVLQKEHIEKYRDKLESGLYELLNKSVDAIKRINKRLCDDKTIGRDRQIGHSFLFRVFKASDLVMVWQYEILPLLEEYCYSDYGRLNRLLFDQASDTDWISQAQGIKGIPDLEAMLDRVA